MFGTPKPWRPAHVAALEETHDQEQLAVRPTAAVKRTARPFYLWCGTIVAY
jgi:hypothetical protein